MSPADWPTLRHNGLDRLEAFFALDIGEPLTKPGLKCWRERRRLVLCDECGRRQVYFLKRYLQPPLSAQLRRLLSGRLRRGSGPLEAANAAALRAAGVRTYRVAAYGQQLYAGIEQRSFLLAGALEGESLERCWPDQRARLYDGLPFDRRQALIQELAGFIARFHAAGFVHRDLYFAHVFFNPAAPEGRRFSLIDLHRVFRPPVRRRRWVVKDLAALEFSAASCGVTRGDRIRFLHRYLQASGWPEPRRCRVLLRAVAAKSRRIAARHLRRKASQPGNRPVQRRSGADGPDACGRATENR